MTGTDLLGVPAIKYLDVLELGVVDAERLRMRLQRNLDLCVLAIKEKGKLAK